MHIGDTIDIDATILMARRHEASWKMRWISWARCKRAELRRTQGTSQGWNLKNPKEGDEPWLDFGDGKKKYGEKNGHSEYGLWTLTMIHVLSCLHRTTRNFYLWCSEDAGSSVERIDTASAIALELKTVRTSVVKVLKKLETIGAVECAGLDGRRKVYDITDYGVRLLWTGISRRMSRRSKFMDNTAFWTKMADGLETFEFDALAIIRTFLHTRAMYIAGSDHPEYVKVRRVRHTRKGPQVYHRRELIIERANRAPMTDAWGEREYQSYCWRPNLVWKLMRKVPMGYLQFIFKKALAGLKEGKIRNFFAYTFGTLMCGHTTRNGRPAIDRVLGRMKRFDGLMKSVGYNDRYARVQEIRESGGSIMYAVRRGYDEHYSHRMHYGPMTRLASIA